MFLHRLIAFIKVNTHIVHLLLNGEFPKVGPRGLISLQGLFDYLGNSVSKLRVFPPISLLDFGNDFILPKQYILNPSLELRLFLQFVCHCVFRELHGI